MKKIIPLILGIYLAACSGNIAMPTSENPPLAPELTPDEGEFPADHTAWLQENAIPFNTTQPGADNRDLEDLRDIVGSARIVALGEATHGTHEFFQMKHRLLEFLVEEMGFTVFAMEAYWAESNAINEYIQTGEGNASKLLEYIQTGEGNASKLLADLGYWTWQTQEVLDLIEWMQEYNQDPNHQSLSFYGFDMQNAKEAIDQLLGYLMTVDPDSAASARSRLYCFSQFQIYSYQQTQYAQQESEIKQSCRQDIERVVHDLIDHQKEYAAQSSLADFTLALQAGRVIQQAEKMAAAAEEGHVSANWFNSRDQAMAENVSWLLDHAGTDAKAVLWAHNVHLQTTDWEFNGFRYRTMGVHLRQAFGDDLVVFGFSHFGGVFNAIDFDGKNNQYGEVIGHQLPDPMPNSYEEALKSADAPRYFLNLRQFGKDFPEGGWWSHPHWLSVFGSTYDPRSDIEDNAYVVVLPEAFDVMVFFKETGASILLP
jgi:erythromycin esterase